MLHPYPFKWRWRRFSGLVIMIMRNMGKASELDVKISESIFKIEKLERRLDELKSRVQRAENKDKVRLQKKIDEEKKNMKKEIGYFCKEVRSELKDFNSSDIDDYTLLYRGSKHLMELAKVITASKNIDKKKLEGLKKRIRVEMSSIKGGAESLKLQSKYIERGVASTVALSQISPLGNSWIERIIKRNSIEVNQINNLLKSSRGKDFSGYFEKEIEDICEIGKNINILIKRLKITFSSVRSKLKNRGIHYSELDKTQKFFEATFNRMERISKRLSKEMNDQANNLTQKLMAA